MSEFDYRKVSDPLYFKENRLAAHSDHVCFRSWEEERIGQSSLRFSLDGVWKFFYAPTEAFVPQGFTKRDGEAPGLDCRSWEDIRVPAHIQMEGYGHPHYTNTAYPWDGAEAIEPGQIPEKFNPTACYVRYFYVPENMKGKRVFISFQGAESGLAVWLNGTYIGYSENSFDPADFELTDALTDGENKLAVEVFRWTSGSWAEDQDFFRFSGLFRSVYLYEVPEAHIQDIRIRTDLDETLEKGVLRVRLETFGSGSVFLKLSDRSGRVASAETQIGGTGDETELSLDVASPRLWSAEYPYLYDLLIDVKNENNETCEVIRQRVGFRKFEIRNSIMYLNGKRILFHGVDRHDFSAKNGRAVTREEILKDIVTMKRNNINAIRTSHYPDVSYLYDLCDEYGIYLIAENNMETHGTWDPIMRGEKDQSYAVPGDREDWLPVMLDRVTSCYERDKNHPSVLIWSVGNESYGGSVIFRMSERFRELDPTRPVHYEGVANDRRYNGSSDIESRMYPPVTEVRAFLKEHRDKPFIMCEYTHAMGNSCGAMFKYTDLENEDPLYQGGFIWDYIDQSITTRNRFGELYEAYGGDFGDHPNDGDFSGNGIAYGGDRDPSPKMQSVRYNYRMIRASLSAEKDGTVLAHVKNNYLFTDTGDFDAELVLEKEGNEICRRRVTVSVAPGEEADFALPVRIPGAGSDGEEETVRTPDDSSCGRAASSNLVSPDGEYAVTLRFLLRRPTLWADAGFEVTAEQAVFEVRDGCISKLTAETWQEEIAEEAARTDGTKSTASSVSADCGDGCRAAVRDETDGGAEAVAFRSLDLAGRYARDSQRIFAGNELLHRAGLADANLRKPLRTVRGFENVGVIGENFRVLFSRKLGRLVSYRYAGREMLDAPVHPNFWRAPIANDRGNLMQQRLVQWKTASLYPTARDFREGSMGFIPDVKEERDRVTVTLGYYLPTTPAAACFLAYTVFGDGTVLVRESMDIPEGLGTMPEFGAAFRMDADYDRISWYGLGPDETYADRTQGARLGIWSQSVRDAMADYLVPQESGAKLGVRWAKVTDMRGRGLVFAGDRMMISALPWSVHEIEQADHPYELPRVCHTFVRVAKGQMGVGGDDSWGARPHSEFLLPDHGHVEFTFAFRGV